MDPLWRTALWQQFGATIDMLENTLLACPSTLWQERLWSDHSDHPPSSQFDAFWSLTHRALFWLDFYLTGSLEGFAPPTPFTVDEEGAPERILPKQPYTREELRVYLVQLRQKCQTTLLSLSDEQAHVQVVFPWCGEEPMSFWQLQLLSMRNVQHHAAQLSLFLGQHAVPDEALDWVPQVKGDGCPMLIASSRLSGTENGVLWRFAGQVRHCRAAGMATSLDNPGFVCSAYL